MSIVYSYNQLDELTINKTKDMLEEFQEKISTLKRISLKSDDETEKLYSEMIIKTLDLKEYNAYYIGIRDTNRFIVMEVCSKSFLKIRVFRHWIGKGLLDKPVNIVGKDKMYILFSIYHEAIKEENANKIKRVNKSICEMTEDTNYIIYAGSNRISLKYEDFDRLTIYLYLKDNKSDKENINLLLAFKNIGEGKGKYYIVKFSNDTVSEIRKSDFDYLDIKTNLLSLVCSSFNIKKYLKHIKGELKEIDYPLVAQAKMIEALGITLKCEINLIKDVYIMKNEL